MIENKEKRQVRKMAIRNIRTIGDEILTKKCKVVKEMTEKNKELIQDM